jgi:CubicO group peptidase (beta-lactamase class C family)
MKKQRITFLVIICLIVFFVLTCEKDTTPIDSKPSHQWQISSPNQQGLNDSLINSALTVAESYDFIHCLLIVRNGFLVAEKYYRGHQPEDSYNVKSVSKSFISALVGIALREGYLDSLNQKMIDFFPEYNTPSLDPRTKQITIRHLISMRAGFDNLIEDYDVNWQHWINSSDWIKYAIELPMEYTPGTRFAYITAETHLVSAILTKATGMSTMAFANKYLFYPLKISVKRWDKDPQGYYIGGMDMYFTPRDMARFGLLYLKDGIIDGQQIVPFEWVQESRQYYSTLSGTWGRLNEMGYGYFWWLGKINNYFTFFALGYGGQYVMVFPALEMIVVTTSDHWYYKDVADAHERVIQEITADYILPAVEN